MTRVSLKSCIDSVYTRDENQVQVVYRLSIYSGRELVLSRALTQLILMTKVSFKSCIDSVYSHDESQF